MVELHCVSAYPRIHSPTHSKNSGGGVVELYCVSAYPRIHSPTHSKNSGGGVVQLHCISAYPLTNTLQKFGGGVVELHCVSAYPPSSRGVSKSAGYSVVTPTSSLVSFRHGKVCSIQGSPLRLTAHAGHPGHESPSCSERDSATKMSKLSRFGIGTSLLVIPAFLLYKHYSRCEAEHGFSPKVAVIGAGIGGSTAAHFCRRLFGPAATIEVFEALPRLGGRLATVEIDGKSYEAGGSVIHPSNQHMDAFVKELGMKLRCCVTHES